jgi:hypothetical protein
LYATVSTWRLAESIRDPEAYEAFLRDLIEANIDIARDVGMLDAMMIRSGTDTMIAVAVYETEAEAIAAGPIARERVGTRYDHQVELISRYAGPCQDMPALTGR